MKWPNRVAEHVKCERTIKKFSIRYITVSASFCQTGVVLMSRRPVADIFNVPLIVTGIMTVIDVILAGIMVH